MDARRRATPAELPWAGGAATKLTVYAGRTERIAGRPAYEATVAFLDARRIAGATRLLGVDSAAHGVRQRARFFARNCQCQPGQVAEADEGLH